MFLFFGEGSLASEVDQNPIINELGDGLGIAIDFENDLGAKSRQSEIKKEAKSAMKLVFNFSIDFRKRI